MAATLAFLPCSFAQGNLLTVPPPAKVVMSRGGTQEVKLPVQLRPGYHVNSNTPTEDYLIPLRLQWESTPAVKAGSVAFPKPEMQKYDFSEKPISVFTGNFDITTKFEVAPNAPAGPGTLAGKLRYQACSNNACFPPRTIDVRVPYQIR